MWHASPVIKTMVVLHDDLSPEQAHRALLSLLAMGFDAESASAPLAPGMPGSERRWRVVVAEDQVERARPLLEDALATEPAPPPPAPAPPLLGDAAIWTWGNSASSLAIAAACVAVHAHVHSGESETTRSAMVAGGAVAPWLVRDGEWWRLASAVFLHFDLKHLIGNTSALLFLGPPLASQIGHLRTFVLFVATGVAGNVVSQVLGSEAAVKAGASGGVCGLLGALAGVALSRIAAAEDARARRPAWQTLGALVALFGMMVGFEPGRDHYAHVGGVVAGLFLGRAFGVGSEPVRAATVVNAGSDRA
jgi:membrane associated rhomboid family serine protease